MQAFASKTNVSISCPRLMHLSCQRTLSRSRRSQSVGVFLFLPISAAHSRSVVRICDSRTLTKSVWTERDVMSKVRSAFCLNLLHAYQVCKRASVFVESARARRLQDADDLYLLMPFYRGGDLDYYLEVSHASSCERKQSSAGCRCTDQ